MWKQSLILVAALSCGLASEWAQEAQGDYRAGVAAIDARQYDRAIAAFDAAIRGKDARSDGALYWKAWAENRLGRRDEALATLAELGKSYPASRWQEDAKALEVEVRQASGAPVPPESAGDDDLKLLALNALVNSDPDRALPMLEKILKSGNSRQLKERALFVLAQSGSPKARDILAGVAKGQGNPELQGKAVEYLGIFGGKESRQLLVDAYRASNSAELKRRILNSLMVSGDRADLLAVAKSEKDPELRRHAVNQLGVSGGVDELMQLYSTESDAGVKRAVIDGLFVSGHSERLMDLVKTERDAGLRAHAIEKLGLMGREKTGDYLVSIYAKDADAAARRAAINGLFLQGNAKALVELAKKETDPARKREIVQKLSIMNSKEGNDYLLDLLNK